MAHGFDTGFDPRRSVERKGLAQRRAAQYHYQKGKSAQDVLNMDPQQWAAESHEFWNPDFVADQAEVASLMRAYEHYSL